MLHRFKPTHYFQTIGTHEPVLKVKSGDTIVTSCVDASGQDERNKRVTHGPNPMTGPFFVEGAKRGDTLAVHIERITPNRKTGWVRTTLAPNVVDPDYNKELPDRQHAFGVWQVDLKRGTATLISPETKLGALSLPLCPFPGCFGVAPNGGEAISTATSGAYGGNMDYNGFVAGTIVYFPVFADGALFHIGDGHARQGDGEIAGTGIEISTEVQFTLRVLKKKKINTVRGENDEYIFTVGNARPLDSCVQIATTEMARWLSDDYSFGQHEIGILMGQAAEYDLGNMFDPAYTMVCKMSKKLLSR